MPSGPNEVGQPGAREEDVGDDGSRRDEHDDERGR